MEISDQELSDFQYLLREVESYYQVETGYALRMLLEAERTSQEVEMAEVTKRRYENIREEVIEEAVEEMSETLAELDTDSLEDAPEVAELWSNTSLVEEIGYEEVEKEVNEIKNELAEGYEALHQKSLMILSDPREASSVMALNEMDLLLETVSRAEEYTYLSNYMAEFKGNNFPSDEAHFDPGEAIGLLEQITISSTRGVGKNQNTACYIIEGVSRIAQDYGVMSDVIESAKEKAQTVLEVERTIEELSELEEKADESEPDVRKAEEKIEEATEKLESVELEEGLKEHYMETLKFFRASR